MRNVLSLVVLALGTSSALAQVGAQLPDPTSPAVQPSRPGQGNQLLPPGALPADVPPAGPIQECLIGVGQPYSLVDGQGGQCWLRGEYLLWWTKGSRLPPLVTTALPGTTLLPGVLGPGQSGSSVVYGDSNVDNGPRSGGRFTGGFWCDPCRTIGFDASYFFLCDRTTQFNAASDSTLGSALIARPFFDVLTGTQNAQLVAFPLLAGGPAILTATGLGIASGSVQASTYSRFQGADANVFCCLCSGCNYWVQTLAGVRYLQLNEGISIAETTRVNPVLPAGSPFFGGSTISIYDQFSTRNNFYGGQVGLRGQVYRRRAFLEAQCKVALGVTTQEVDIQGATSITSPAGATVVTPVGFLASGSNSGRFSRNRFAVVPEIGVNAGYQVTNHLRVFAGYNFLYWSAVVRPADQIDLGLSGTQIVTDTRYNPTAPPARPAFVFRETSFWAQGVSFGAELRY